MLFSLFTGKKCVQKVLEYYFRAQKNESRDECRFDCIKDEFIVKLRITIGQRIEKRHFERSETGLWRQRINYA